MNIAGCVVLSVALTLTASALFAEPIDLVTLKDGSVILSLIHI